VDMTLSKEEEEKKGIT